MSRHQNGNKEAKKPKQDRQPTAALAPKGSPLGQTSALQARPKKK